MNRNEKRVAVAGVFGVIIAWSVLSNGKGWVVGLGAGVLGGALRLSTAKRRGSSPRRHVF